MVGMLWDIRSSVATRKGWKRRGRGHVGFKCRAWGLRGLVLGAHPMKKKTLTFSERTFAYCSL